MGCVIDMDNDGKKRKRDNFAGVVTYSDGVPVKANVEIMCELCGGYGDPCKECIHYELGVEGYEYDGYQESD